MWGQLDALSLMEQEELKEIFTQKNLEKFRRREHQLPDAFEIDAFEID